MPLIFRVLNARARNDRTYRLILYIHIYTLYPLAKYYRVLEEVLLWRILYAYYLLMCIYKKILYTNDETRWKRSKSGKIGGAVLIYRFKIRLLVFQPDQISSSRPRVIPEKIYLAYRSFSVWIQYHNQWRHLAGGKVVGWAFSPTLVIRRPPTSRVSASFGP